ncbi:MAG: amino acid adenylation domain-containing protein [Candidatus Aminicenantes bacterium]|nr:MAG: amino acid adenylation domain-containing protein [Candidatus Aminicenantes bacterium]
MIAKSDVKDIYFLSPMQEGMLFHYLADRYSEAYFEQMVYWIHGEFDHRLLEQAFIQIIERYDVLRTVFVYEKLQKPLQVVLKKRKASICYLDISHLNKQESSSFQEDFKRKDRKMGFNLSKDLPLRISIIKTAKDTHLMLFSFHHIILDGWSVRIIYKDLLQIYQSFRKGEPLKLEPVKEYKNYIKWLEKQDKEAGIKYWKSYLQHYENQTNIPRYIEGREREDEYELAEHHFKINQVLTEELKRIANENNLTINTIFQCLWGILLQKYNDTNDVVFGTVVSGRPEDFEGIENMVGLFINTIPTRIKNEPGEKFVNLLKKVQVQMTQSKLYEFIPLAEIQANSLLKRALVNHLVVFENYPVDNEIKKLSQDNRSDFWVEHVEVFEQTNYDLNVMGVLMRELEMGILYNSIAYNADVIKRIETHLISIIEQFSINPGIPVEEIEIISPLEKKQLLFGFNRTEAGYPQNKTIHELFEEQVERTPGSIAVVGQSSKRTAQSAEERYAPCAMRHAITYRALNKISAQLAHLLQQRGVQPDTIVGIMADRSVEMIIAILAILKSGGAYMPIDPEYPAERINYMLKDSQVGILVTSPKLQVKAKAEVEEGSGQPQGLPLQTINIEKDIFYFSKSTPSTVSQVGPANLAYGIYTSGTTDKPKGTLITHRNVVRLLFNDRFQFDFNSRDTWTLFHSYCFDFSVWEMYGALLYGGKLRLIPRITAVDTREFLEILAKENITVLNQTPSAFYNLANLEVQNPNKHLYLKYVIFGGEALTPLKLQQWKNKYPETRLINMFGITETTVHVTYKEIEHRDIRLNISNIGQPIPTLSTYIMGRGQQLLPLGVTGEICVGGEGVGRGYLNRPELTSEKFVNHPYITGQRLYRSGDLGRLLENGDMEYLSRIDYQVKIRGFRIEPGEIANQLLRHEDINDAVVSPRKKEDGEAYLCAYVVTQREFSAPELKEYLARELPAYMIPSYFIRIKNVPLTPNGKVDQKVLHSLDMNLKTGSEYAAPENETEELIAAAWKEVLHNDNLGVHDNFFDIGGHSLNLIQLNGKLNQVFQKDIPIVEMFRYPTIRSLAQHIDDKKTPEFISDEKIDRSLNIMEETTNFFFGDSDEMM